MILYVFLSFFVLVLFHFLSAWSYFQMSSYLIAVAGSFGLMLILLLLLDTGHFEAIWASVRAGQSRSQETERPHRDGFGIFDSGPIGRRPKRNHVRVGRCQRTTLPGFHAGRRFMGLTFILLDLTFCSFFSFLPLDFFLFLSPLLITFCFITFESFSSFLIFLSLDN